MIDRTPHHPFDLVVVGAGIVGLAHAVDAVLRGMSVAVIERDDRAVGASIRNFGHICTTAQSGHALTLALSARERWLTLGRKAGFEVRECGTLVIARATDELAVLEEFAAERGSEQVTLHDAAGPIGGLGVAHLPLDLRVDPREAVPAIAEWLTSEGVEFFWNTHVGEITMDTAEPIVHTSRGDIRGRHVVHSVGHDVDRLFPDIAAEWNVERCRLQMLEIAPPGGVVIDPAILTGLSMLRYDGLAAMPSATAVRTRMETDSPELLDVVMNLMLTQRPDGAIVLGDTHHHARTHTPFEEERNAELLLREGARLFGTPLTVLRRWRGIYATSPRTDFLTASPAPNVRVVSVTSGIGMTTAFGLAPTIVDSF
ncbi:TIGR03364 family FAD-dependent oxidoreductase [Rhodococcus sp. G-MC3]|uniref:TIGR03364 family FAD-dependent oxidoreductase n=1 Tax=Rhodococcus sp. G-MC3 TaxID=3046209 RepID=UPI0024B968E2|nr:TIGR03364 family FAD-dependent oxidoreductase [Rhodococcus sp. G-MC3]MDJ0392475.1 TIGR03364 family FAD-dependent oxidoreductase [Rhodococcus sp. G-MC3]